MWLNTCFRPWMFWMNKHVSRRFCFVFEHRWSKAWREFFFVKIKNSQSIKSRHCLTIVLWTPFNLISPFSEYQSVLVSMRNFIYIAAMQYVLVRLMLGGLKINSIVSQKYKLYTSVLGSCQNASSTISYDIHWGLRWNISWSLPSKNMILLGNNARSK